MKSKIAHKTLIEKRNRIKKHALKPACTDAHKIDKYLTPRKKNCWRKLNHNLISTKKRESKQKRCKNGQLELPSFPVFKIKNETKNHCNNECPIIMQFRKKLQK